MGDDLKTAEGVIKWARAYGKASESVDKKQAASIARAMRIAEAYDACEGTLCNCAALIASAEGNP